MTYVAHITVPVVFHADDDDAARVILEQLRCHLAGVSVRFDGIPDSAGPEVSDYPDASLQEVLRYEEPRVVEVYA
jgi:hypothetical protein